jgi:predicted nucleic acid-binding protein
MNQLILLDSGPLGMLAHPRPNPEIVDWLQKRLHANARVVIPEIADYEVRREFLLKGLLKSRIRLDQLKISLDYEPITTDVMLKAAEFWAATRKRGKPTAHQHALDGDVILAAQAVILANQGYDVIVATTNVKHLSLFVQAKLWQEIK